MNSLIFGIDPIAFLGIRWYAICILTGILLGLYMGIKEGKKLGIYTDFVYNGVLYCVPLSIIGARIWYVIYNLDEFDSLTQVLGLDGGGLSGLGIQGAVIVAICFVIIYSKKKGISFFKTFDILAPGLLIGQICGRWGNFFNQELYGPIVKNVDLFKNLLPSFITDNMYISGFYRHPVFLYESILNFIGLIIILVLRRKSKQLRTGDTIGIYLVWYGIVRIITETLRGMSDANEILMFGPIRVSVLVSVLFIIAGILYLVLKRVLKLNDENYLEVLKSVEENKYDTILFDLDGTLVDTKKLIDYSFVSTFEHFFSDITLTDEDLLSFFGPPLKVTFARYTTDEDLNAKMCEYYRKINKEAHDELITAYPNLSLTLKTLKKKGYKVGIVSSKRTDMVLKALDLFHVTSYFDTVIGEDDVINHKPHEEGILKAMGQLGSVRAIYVGDNPSDIICGKNAKISTCAVRYSHRFLELEELNPDYIIDNLIDMLKILNE